MSHSIAAIITAAGSSSRIGVKKEYRLVGDKTDMEGKPLTVLGKAALAFAACSRIDMVVITVPRDANLGEIAARDSIPGRLLRARARPKFLFVAGGPTRRSSVHHALELLKSHKPGYVLIHDGARPWVEPTLIDRVIDAMLKHQAAPGLCLSRHFAGPRKGRRPGTGRRPGLHRRRRSLG